MKWIYNNSKIYENLIKINNNLKIFFIGIKKNKEN